MRHPSAFIGFILLASAACADELDQHAIAATAKRTGATEQRVREAAEKGCDSDMFSMNLCAEYQFVAASIRLDQVFERLRKRHRQSKSGAILLKSQRAWLAYRDTACTFESSGVEGGSLHAYSSLRCMREKTVLRTTELAASEACTQPGCPS